MNTANTVSINAYAKINLFLDITGRRDDGYHELNNIMQKIDLHDAVTVKISRGKRKISVHCDNRDVPCDKRNIAYKAAEAYLDEAGIDAEIDIEIEKRIPLMAGLGGSSTDGAAVLKALEGFFGGIGKDKLNAAAAKLGADVPFCLSGKAALCKGIGEAMTEITGLPDCSLLIVKPDFSCSTAKAYGLYDENPIKSRGEPLKLLKALSEGSIVNIGEELYNVFEPLYNDGGIQKIKNALIECGSSGALLTGSGSAVYGIFSDRSQAEKAGSRFSCSQYIKFVTNPCSGIEIL